jgi:hypothetical protein
MHGENLGERNASLEAFDVVYLNNTVSNLSKQLINIEWCNYTRRVCAICFFQGARTTF